MLGECLGSIFRGHLRRCSQGDVQEHIQGHIYEAFLGVYLGASSGTSLGGSLGAYVWEVSRRIQAVSVQFWGFKPKICQHTKIEIVV